MLRRATAGTVTPMTRESTPESRDLAGANHVTWQVAVHFENVREMYDDAQQARSEGHLTVEVLQHLWRHHTAIGNARIFPQTDPSEVINWELLVARLDDDE